MGFDWQFMWGIAPTFVTAIKFTLQVGCIAVLFALLIGLLNLAILSSPLAGARHLVQFYVDVARNIPLLIQLFFIYFALPSVGIDISNVTSAMIAMSFTGGAYMTEILRACVANVAKGQLDAGAAIGLSTRQVWWHVILPQAFTASLPSLFATFVYLLRETTVASAVAVPEILYTTKNYIGLYYKTYESLTLMTLSCAIIYLPLSIALYKMEHGRSHA